MITKAQAEKARKQALEYYDKARIFLTESEKAGIEVADFGLSRLDEMGLEIVTYVNTERCCAKELVLFPWQICPEHRHPPISAANPGKEETFRVRYGTVYFYTEGEPAAKPKGKIPADKKAAFTVWHEAVLNQGEQYTLKQNTKHWFQGGKDGAVVSEFSTKSIDEKDIFTDAEINRIPVIE